jgi:hypothetical protein
VHAGAWLLLVWHVYKVVYHRVDAVLELSVMCVNEGLLYESLCLCALLFPRSPANVSLRLCISADGAACALQHFNMWTC